MIRAVWQPVKLALIILLAVAFGVFITPSVEFWAAEAMPFVSHDPLSISGDTPSPALIPIPELKP